MLQIVWGQVGLAALAGLIGVVGIVGTLSKQKQCRGRRGEARRARRQRRARRDRWTASPAPPIDKGADESWRRAWFMARHKPDSAAGSPMTWEARLLLSFEAEF